MPITASTAKRKVIIVVYQFTHRIFIKPVIYRVGTLKISDPKGIIKFNIFS